MIKKINFLVLATIFMTFLLSTTVGANAQLPSGYLRVGLGSPTYYIESQSPSLEVLLSTGSSFLNMGSITGASNFSITTDDDYYVFMHYVSPSDAADFNAFSRAIQLAAMAPRAVAALSWSGQWAVYAGPFTSEAEALASTGASVTAIRMPTGRRLALYSGWHRIVVFDNDLFTPLFAGTIDPNTLIGMINIDGHNYRGYLQAHRSGTNVTAVNVVHIEDYLLSVVPSEMPAGWPLHALKAQAIAARSYTHTQIGVHSERGYDLCSTVCCQVYLGMRQESLNSTAAVNGTRGIVALHGGNIINAVYSSSSGGITDNSENVWTQTVPYLRSVPDIHDTTGREWSRAFTRSELTQLAAANDQNIGAVQSVHIEPSQTGRVHRLILTGQTGQITLEREAIRTFFSLSSGGSLYSRNFRIDSFNITQGGAPLVQSGNIFVINRGVPELRALSGLRFLNGMGEPAALTGGNVNVQVADGRRVLNLQGMGTAPTNPALGIQISGGLSSSGDTITFVGRGWGHGVGMSQHGARGMAYVGYTFEQILNHYYTGITLGVREDFR